jgi:hypothetical protein
MGARIAVAIRLAFTDVRAGAKTTRPEYLFCEAEAKARGGSAPESIGL